MEKPKVDSKHIVKWVVIGALGTMSIFVVFIAILIYMFTPLIKVDDATGNVSLFGGVVAVKAATITKFSKDSSFVFGSMTGIQKLAPEIKTIEVKFATGEMRIDYNDTEELNWDCDGAGKNSKFESQPETGIASLDFSGAFVDCDISVPKKNISVTGSRGQIEIRKMQTPLTVSLQTGDVYLQPIEKLQYKYTITSSEDAENDSFSSSVDAKALPIQVDVRVGNVLLLD